MFQSSTLNTNLRPFLSWKGQTFGQITSSIQKNGNATLPEQKSYSQPTSLAFLPPPLKIYRREAFTKPLKTESSKQSTSIELLERPGSSLVVFDNTKGWNVCDSDCSGNKLTLDTNLINNRGERGLCCDTSIAEQLNPASVADVDAEVLVCTRKKMVFCNLLLTKHQHHMQIPLKNIYRLVEKHSNKINIIIYNLEMLL